MVDKFPQTAQAARGIKETDWQSRLFVLHEMDSQTWLPVPRNLADFSENLLMITILKIATSLGWSIHMSEVDLPSSVLKTDKGMYFAGYTSMALSKETGHRIKPSNLYEKGQLRCQTDAVIESVGTRNTHIRKVEHSPGKILSEMAGFTRKWWGLRGVLSTLFASLPKPKATNIASYMLVGGELIGKVVRNKLPYSNGGIYRTAELAYFDKKYANTKKKLEEIQTSSKAPTEDFARSFWDKIDSLAGECKDIEKALGGIFAARARVLFRGNSKKKSDIKWNQLPLDDKLSSLSVQDYTRLFTPINLPGFTKSLAKADDTDSLDEFCKLRFRLNEEDNLYDDKLEVCRSYQIILDSLLGE
jgi:hypothetical protein